MPINPLHRQLDCGVELVALQLQDRRAVAMDIRMFAGLVHEPADKLGIAHLVEETLNKGTKRFEGRELNDAFDEIGTSVNSWSGRETAGFSSLCLPEFFERNVELKAEFLRCPTFPDPSCHVARQLAQQELLTLEDDPQSLADKFLSRQVYGPILGRHVGGEAETLEQVTRPDFESFWRKHYGAGRTLVSVVGPLDVERVADLLERQFEGFGSPETYRRRQQVDFSAVCRHHPRDTEQQQIGMAMPGVALDHADYPAERMLVGILAGGMSARLFTEVREKRGLVYWVSAWGEYPRGAGMIFVGASTTPQRCDQTYETLLRELDRVGEDVSVEELQRALASISVRADIRADVTRSRCAELADDLLHYGHPVPWEEKLARLQAVTVDDVKRYCATYLAKGGISIVTLGPRALESTPPRSDTG